MTDGNRLGEGAYGEVYKIKKKKTKEICAGKFFKVPKDSMNSKEIIGYERESEILKTSDHPFVVKYIEEFMYN